MQLLGSGLWLARRANGVVRAASSRRREASRCARQFFVVERQRGARGNSSSSRGNAVRAAILRRREATRCARQFFVVERQRGGRGTSTRRLRATYDVRAVARSDSSFF